MRISDWSADVCSSDLLPCRDACRGVGPNIAPEEGNVIHVKIAARQALDEEAAARDDPQDAPIAPAGQRNRNRGGQRPRSEGRRLGNEGCRTWRYGWGQTQ